MRETMERAAGRELDAEIAEHVMGWAWDESRCRVCGWPLEAERCTADGCSMRPAPVSRADAPPHYSTDIAAAWTVVEKMARRRWVVDVQNRQVYRWACHVGFPAPNYARVFEVEDTAPLAICRAALAAVATPTPEERPDGQ